MAIFLSTISLVLILIVIIFIIVASVQNLFSFLLVEYDYGQHYPTHVGQIGGYEQRRMRAIY
jgi:hypothetical protein